ncbi:MULTISPECIES: hypothetical protein [Actinosynnema]|uniref:hypothetical protein n=1 Tax=Actinosynnema TaxID=40566 RepID=UPI0020A314B4|nr:hypothetical protein [Actinosynnema pretiosum]MCP2094572.1 hypothetical protein [Actinosynnema pretiosum]
MSATWGNAVDVQPGGLAVAALAATPVFTDRVAAAERMLRERPASSDRGIAAATGLAAGTVAAIRLRLGEAATARIGRDGRIRPVSCADGREAAASYLARYPAATLRAVASAAGISLGTARDVRDRLRRGQEVVPARARTGRVPPTVRPAPPPSARVALAVLRNDPSLRGASTGRQLLRLFDAHAAVADWQRLAETLPPHCALLVAGLVAEYAQRWSALAASLDRARRASGG